MDNYYYVEERHNNDIPISIGIPLEFTKPSYNKFLLKVLFILMLQFIITTAFVFTGYYFRNYFISNTIISSYLFVYSTFTFVISLLIIICCRFGNKYILYILFTLFTFSSSILLAMCVIQYSANIILLASLGTLICILTTIIYALLSYIYNFEIHNLAIVMISLSFACLPLTLIQGFILNPSNLLYFFLAFLFIILFNIYLMYDIQTLYNHTDKLLIFDNPIYPAISIYLDIINIFLYLLECINIIKHDN